VTAIVLSAVLVCLGALVLGQAVLRMCGYRRWSWLAPAVGLAAELLVALPCLYLPGNSTTAAVVLGLLVAMSALAVLRDPAMRPPIVGFLAAGPVAAMTLVPFAAAGRHGTLGVSFNNDMSAHLWFAELYRSGGENALPLSPPGYPVGPHALVATLAQGLGVGVDATFAAVTAAAAVLLAWTAIGLLGPRAGWLGRFVAATVAGMPFLVAGYYGQGSFKEVILALFVAGVAVALVDRPERRGVSQWIPLAILVVGGLAVYSVLALVWLVGLAGAVLAFELARAAATRSPRAALSMLRDGVTPVTIAVGAAALLVVPQLSRLDAYGSYVLSSGGGSVENIAPLGNLAARLPLWQAFGIWDNPDYRFGVLHLPSAELWTMLVVVLVALGALWCVRRGDWILPIAALVTLALWAISDSTQTPYVTAKALVIMSPLLMLLAVRPLVERDAGLPRLWRYAPLLLALVVVAKVAQSSVQALRASPVGPTAHLDELRSLRPLLHRKPTLFLGNDDYVYWELAGVPVFAPGLGAPGVKYNDPKTYMYGQALDIDTIHADTLNTLGQVITTRDAAASAMPRQLRLVRQTRNYALWRRTGKIAPRAVLAEGDAGGAILDCSKPAGRRVLRGGGVAHVRPSSIGVQAPPFAAGTSIGIDIPLPPGTYDLSTPYVSAQPIDLEVVGHLKATLPANLDRPGPRWPIGRVTIRPGEPRLTRIGMYARRTRFTGAVTITPASVVATPVGGARAVAMREACGRYVDFYEPAAAKSSKP
jgi:hypothetical protein